MIMKDLIIKANVYETQAILYFILGELILHLGDFKWLGWTCIIYGWITFVVAILIVIKGAKQDLITKE